MPTYGLLSCPYLPGTSLAKAPTPVSRASSLFDDEVGISIHDSCDTVSSCYHPSACIPFILSSHPIAACTALIPDFDLFIELNTGPDLPFLTVLNLISSDARSSPLFRPDPRSLGVLEITKDASESKIASHKTHYSLDV